MSNSEWTQTEIEYGRFKVTNGDIIVSIRADFGGTVENEAGDYFEFKDLRVMIEASKLLEKALIDHYGGWK